METQTKKKPVEKERAGQKMSGAEALLLAMLEEGVYIIAFSYPVVPKGKARIRVQISAALTTAELDTAIAAFTKVGKKLSVI
jgi:glycine C-acetyltransferase